MPPAGRARKDYLARVGLREGDRGQQQVQGQNQRQMTAAATDTSVSVRFVDAIPENDLGGLRLTSETRSLRVPPRIARLGLLRSRILVRGLPDEESQARHVPSEAFAPSPEGDLPLTFSEHTAIHRIATGGR